MKVTKDMVKLICDLEYMIGSNCYNPNSYNGWTGEEGCSYRYPVKYRNSNDEMYLHSTRYKIDEIDTVMIETMKYVFGTNHLFIGDGIVQMLSFLERRYGIDFQKLESELKDNR